jgi:hypothetical protein
VEGSTTQGRRRSPRERISGWSDTTKRVAEAIIAILTLLTLLGVWKAASGDEAKTARDVRIDPSAIRVQASLPALRRQDDDRDANDYVADNLLDGDVKTAWAEGRRGLGIGARLRFTLPQRAELTRIRIVNGYGKSRAHLLDNAAAKAIVIDTDGNREPLRRQLSRTARPQSIQAKFGATRNVTITIASAYPGDRFEDLAISEVSFYAERT